MKAKVTARSTNTPPLSGAEAFARLLAAVMAKKPDLKVVEPIPERGTLRRYDKWRQQGRGASGVEQTHP